MKENQGNDATHAPPHACRPALLACQPCSLYNANFNALASAPGELRTTPCYSTHDGSCSLDGLPTCNSAPPLQTQQQPLPNLRSQHDILRDTLWPAPARPAMHPPASSHTAAHST